MNVTTQVKTMESKKPTTPSQCQRILHLLSDGQEHSNRDLMILFIPKYTSRISDLREAGFNIHSSRQDTSHWTYRWVMTSAELEKAYHYMPDKWRPRIYEQVAVLKPQTKAEEG